MRMDMMSMVTSLLAMKAANTQGQIAATIVKSNADAERSTVLTLLSGQGAALAPGVGGNLDISA
jgi:putative motility protein YjfB-like